MRAKKTDQNQKSIVKTLRMYGLSVFDLSAVGKGICDLIVGFRGKNYLIEIKNPERKWKHTAEQEKFIRTWKGQRYTAETAEEILKYLGLLK